MAVGDSQQPVLAHRVGDHDGVPWSLSPCVRQQPPAKIIEVPDDGARRLIADGLPDSWGAYIPVEGRHGEDQLVAWGTGVNIVAGGTVGQTRATVVLHFDWERLGLLTPERRRAVDTNRADHQTTDDKPPS